MKVAALGACLLLCAACCACSPFFQGMGMGIVEGSTNPEAQKKFAELSAAATKAAVAEALGPDTAADIKALIAGLDPEIQKIIADSGAAARAQIDALITDALQDRIRQTVRLALDEALGPKTLAEEDALREELVGGPLQKDLDALIDSAAPHLSQALAGAVQSSLAPLQANIVAMKTNADVEAQKWKPIAIGFGVGSGILFLCLILAVMLVRSHHKTIQALVQGRSIES